MRRLRVAMARLRARRAALRRGVEIGKGVRFGRGVHCSAAPEAFVRIGEGTEVGANTGLSAQGGLLEVGRNVRVSGGCIIAAAQRITIGDETMIAELVSIRDHDHDPAYPPRSGALLTDSVRIGSRVWIGAKATIVRGGSIGDDAVIGAHAVVNRSIPANVLAVGVPARIAKHLERRGS